MPSSRPRWSPLHDLALEEEWAAEELGGRATSPAATSPRMWLEETVSPATSTSGTTRVSNSVRAEQPASPSRPCPKRKFSPTDTFPAPSRPTRMSSTNSSASRAAKSSSKGIDHELLHAQAGDQVALDRGRGQQLRRGLRADHRQRVRVEGEHGVAVRDHLAVAEVDPVEGPDRHGARPPAGSTSGRRVTFIRARRLRRAGARHPAARPRPRARPHGSGAPAPPARPARAGAGRARRPRPRARRADARVGTPSARASGTSRSGSASSRRNGPMRVRSSSSQ